MLAWRVARMTGFPVREDTLAQQCGLVSATTPPWVGGRVKTMMVLVKKDMRVTWAGEASHNLRIITQYAKSLLGIHSHDI